MNYLKIKIDTSQMATYEIDLLINSLAEIDFESFENDDSNVFAYVQKTLFNEEGLKSLLDSSYEIEEIEEKNWNEEWEQNYFTPIQIGEDCVIHSSFHKDVPKAKYEIMIDPKMSFGTGHHETTSLMTQWILEEDMAGKDVLDMGCGTGILGILAKMRGAHKVTSVDVDEWCVENATENSLLNKVELDIILGDASSLAGRSFDLIFANINRNILLMDMKFYVPVLKEGASLFLSGFYKDDLSHIEQEARRLSLTIDSFKEDNNWVSVKLLK